MRVLQKTYLILLLFPVLLLSQEKNEVIAKQITIEKFVFTLDSFSLIPNSLKIFDQDSNEINSSDYLINEIDAKIKIIDTNLFQETLTFYYNVYPVLLSRTYYHRKLKFIDPEKGRNIYWKPNDKKNNVENDIIKSGEISRNVIMGNNQDLSMISNLDLRIDISASFCIDLHRIARRSLSDR